MSKKLVANICHIIYKLAQLLNRYKLLQLVYSNTKEFNTKNNSASSFSLSVNATANLIKNKKHIISPVNAFSLKQLFPLFYVK